MHAAKIREKGVIHLLFFNNLFHFQLHNAANANQKEKYEADLKKEIKKLQVWNRFWHLVQISSIIVQMDINIPCSLEMLCGQSN